MNDVMSLAIVGAAVSVFVQFIKSIGDKTPHWLTLALVIALSLLAGAFYQFIKDTNVTQAVLQIVLYANAFYGFIIKAFEPDTSGPQV